MFLKAVMIILSAVLIQTNCYSAETIKAEGLVKVTIVAPEQIEVTPENGTAVYDENGNIIQVVF